VRTRGLFAVEREDWDLMSRSSALPLFTRVRKEGAFSGVRMQHHRERASLEARKLAKYPSLPPTLRS
jgi:hypothetical protein